MIFDDFEFDEDRFTFDPNTFEKLVSASMTVNVEQLKELDEDQIQEAAESLIQKMKSQINEN